MNKANESQNKSTKPRNGLRFVAFCLGFALLLCAVNHVLRPFKPAFGEYRRLPEGSVQVVVCGTSHMLTGFNTMALWENQGVAAWAFASSTQPFAASYLFLREAFKTQRPKVAVIDLQSALMLEDYAGFITTEARLYDNFDRIPFSLEKLRVLAGLLPAKEFAKYCMPVYTQHSRWSALGRQDLALSQPTAPYAGYEVFFHANAGTLAPDAPVAGRVPISPAAQTWLDAIVALCAGEGIPLVAVLTPCTYRPEVTAPDWQQKLNYTLEYLGARGVACYNYNALADEIGLDYTTDMMDADHLNYYGSLKFTAHFGAVLRRDYGLENQKDGPAANVWNGLLAQYHAYLAQSGVA